MLRLLGTTNIDFMKFRKIALVFSGGLAVATAVFLIVNGGPKLSVDFAGGTMMEIRTGEVLPVEDVRAALEQGGFAGAEIQTLGDGHDILLRFATQKSADAYARIEEAITNRFPNTTVVLRREETVGPKVGSELAEKAIWAILGSLAGILVYVGIRYEFKFAIGAVAALLHDVFIVFGILCFTGREMSLTIVAGLLTLAGYSINDTIVVFDRIRERMKTLRKGSHLQAFNVAINETLSRTLITSVTALFAGLALYFFGGEVINGFALAMVLGIVFGTYSSIFVAAALALQIWDVTDRKKKKTPTRARAA